MGKYFFKTLIILLVVCGVYFSVSISFAADRYWVGGTGNWSDDDNHWATSSGGSAGDGNVPTSSDHCIFDSSSGSGYTVTIDATANCKNFNASLSNSLTLEGSSALNIGGDFSVGGLTTWNHTGNITLNNSNLFDTVNISTNNVEIKGNVNINSNTNINHLFVTNFKVSSDKTFTITAGNVSVSSNNITVGAFAYVASSSTVNLGSGTWTLTGNDRTIWNIDSSASSFFFTPPSSAVVSNYSGSTGTRAIVGASSLGSNNASFDITGGGDIISTTSGIGTLNFSSFSGTWSNEEIYIYGNLTINGSMTLSSGSNSVIFAATSGTKTITTNSQTLNFPITFDGSGGTWQLADALTVGSTRTTTLTNGTFDLNNQNFSTGLFSSNNTNTRVLTLGSGTITLAGTGTVWDIATATNLTLNANTSTIKITNTSGTLRSFSGGGQTYNNFWSSAGTSTAILEILGSNTFNDFKDDGSVAHSILFHTGTTQTVTTFTVSGSAGNLITINSSNGSGSTSTSTHTLTKSGGGTIVRNYLNIQHSVATPSSTWYPGANSVNNQAVATAGSGWVFNTAPSTPTSLGATAYVNGSLVNDSTPTLSFTLTDSDVSDTVKFRIQIDDTSNFGSPVVDYTSALAAQGSVSFTVGQAVGSGTYTTGSANQTLSDTSYYWRVKAIDNSAEESSYATANSGAVAFILDATPPVITITGSNPIGLFVGDSYTDAGATALDAYAGSLTASIITTNSVNTNAAGLYTVVYSVADTAGNNTSSTRNVTVSSLAGGAGGPFGSSYIYPQNLVKPIITNPISTIETKPTLTKNSCIKLPKNTKILRFGMNDPLVKTLQEILNCKGFVLAKTGPGSVGKETTKFANATKLKLIEFQKTNKIKPDGIVGKFTIERLNQ